MTMLDRMRRHKAWLKWSLALVCLAFVIFYIPDFLRGSGADAASSDTLAVVQGREIRADEFRRTYQAQLQAYRAAYGSNMSEQLLKQLGVGNQILQQMLDERASLAEAERLRIRVSDEEVAQRIYAVPAFQEHGAFIGRQRYEQLLRSQRPPITASEFEEGFRRSLIVDKLRASLTDWMTIPDTELEQEFRRKNDKVKVAFVSFPVEKFRPQVSVPDAEVASYFDAHQSDFKIPEKRKVRYLLIDVQALRSKVVIPPADIERAYNDNIEQYTTPEQVRASHILIKTEGKDEATVKPKAEEILKQAKGGADFADLARKHSEDEASAKNGGDLDYFNRGRMVPEFDAAAFAMEPGQISDLVKTQYGFHIIKLVEKKAATSRSLADVREQITDQLLVERAQAQAADLGQSLEKQVSKPSDLDTVAKANGLQVQESGFFTREEPILGVGGSPAASASAFDLKDGEVSGQIRTPRGIVFETVSGKQDSYIPKLDEAKEKVRGVVTGQKAGDLARQKAAQAVVKLRAAADFEKAAKAAGLEPSTTEFIARGTPVGDLGLAPEVTDASFKLPKGGVSEPLATDAGVAIIKVLDKQEATAAEISAQKDTFREELLSERRNRFFSAYMGRAKQKMRIDVNRQALQRVVG